MFSMDSRNSTSVVAVKVVSSQDDMRWDAGSAMRQSLPLDVRGTAFQQRVWQALGDIPPGTRATYSDIAGRLGKPSAVRAVAGACAANKIAVLIPCHRVVRMDGTLSGYRWGVERKKALLDREGSSKS